MHVIPNKQTITASKVQVQPLQEILIKKTLYFFKVALHEEKKKKKMKGYLGKSEKVILILHFLGLGVACRLRYDVGTSLNIQCFVCDFHGG